MILILFHIQVTVWKALHGRPSLNYHNKQTLNSIVETGHLTSKCGIIQHVCIFFVKFTEISKINYDREDVRSL